MKRHDMKQGNVCFTHREHKTSVSSILIHLWWVITVVLAMIKKKKSLKAQILTCFKRIAKYKPSLHNELLYNLMSKCGSCTKATKGAQNSADSNHKNQN